MKKHLVLLCLLCVPQAFAQTFTSGTITIQKPWARATSGMAAGYLTLSNNGKETEHLLGAKVEGVEEAMLHRSQVKNGVAEMSEMANGIPLKPGQTLVFQPGGYHLMWMGLSTPLSAGQKISATLFFKNAGNVPVEFEVQNPTAPQHTHH